MPAGHVLAAVVAGALDDGDGARVSYGEPVARLAGGEQLACGRSVEHRVADDQVLVRGIRVGGASEGPDGDLATAQSLADVVVGLALELQMHASSRNAPKLWPARP